MKLNISKSRRMAEPCQMVCQNTSKLFSNGKKKKTILKTLFKKGIEWVFIEDNTCLELGGRKRAKIKQQNTSINKEI